MGTVLQERARHMDYNHVHHRAKRKASGCSSSSRRIANHDVAQNAEKVPAKETVALTNGLHARGLRTISTAAIIHPREIPSKSKYGASSRKNSQQPWQKDSTPSRLPPVPAPRRASTEREAQEDTDSGTDLSDTERLPQLACSADPPSLRLREEVIEPSDRQPSRDPSRSHVVSRASYPDFLPPPFNSWSLRELAVYLNTDGKTIPRSRPVNQFERYLDRLLQLEWQQMLTLQEESTVQSKYIVRRRPHSSLSAPKSILQCQRAFPFTFLCSVHPQSCSRYPVYTCPQHSHPLMDKRGISKRSSSETRARHLNRLSDSALDHLKRMQAVGNIRVPLTHALHTNGRTEVDPLKRKCSGERSRSCGDVSRKTLTERRSEGLDSRSFGATGSEKEPAGGRTAAKHKHVEFVFQEREIT